MRKANGKEIAAWATIVFLGATFSFAQWKLKSFEREYLNRDTDAAWVEGLPLLSLRGIAANPGVDIAEASESLVDAIIQIESGGDAWAVGNAGERGLMQIKETTWYEMTERLFGRTVPFARAFNADLNRRVGKAYLAELQGFLYAHRDEWQADERSLLLACYNAGPGRVQQAGFNIENIPAFTKNYLKRAVALHDFYLAEDAPQMRRILLAHRNADVDSAASSLQ